MNNEPNAGESTEGVSRNVIQGSSITLQPLDSGGNPVGEAIKIPYGSVSVFRGEDPGVEEGSKNPFETHSDVRESIDITLLQPNPAIMALFLGHRWPTDETLLQMGATWEHDYAGLDAYEQEFPARLTRCYEIAARALVDPNLCPDYLPRPAYLVHGVWSSPRTRDEPINHAWLLLEDGRVWEPISKTLCDREAFLSYTKYEVRGTYNAHLASLFMRGTGHYGPWY